MELSIITSRRTNSRCLHNACLTKPLTVLEVGGAEGLVRDMIS